MRKFFSLVVASILATTSLFAAEVTVTKTIAQVQAYNNWETQYVDDKGFWHRTLNLDENIQLAALPESPESTSTQNGILYLNTTTSAPSDWRIYQARGGFQIIAKEGCVLKSATFEFGNKNNGCLVYGGKNYTTGQTITFDGTKALEEIAVGSTSGKTNGQARITSFTVVYEKKETPTPATKTIYCKMEQGWWKADNAAVGCHYWGTPGPGTTWPGVRMTPVEGETDIWSIDLDLEKVQNVIFTRVSPLGTSFSDWGAKTKDLQIPTDDKNLFTITTSKAVWGDPGCEGEWSVYGGAVEKPKHDYTITVYLPAFCDDIAAYADSVRVMGGFDDWSNGIWMEEKIDEDFNEYWYAEIKDVEEDTEFKLRFGTDADWKVQVQLNGANMANEAFGETTDIVLHYDGEGYGFAACAAPAARKEFVFVAGEAAEANPALFAITWGKDGSNETVKLANKADDIYTAEILETVDSLVLVRCASDAAEIIWDGEGKNVWNQTGNYAICDTMYFGAWVDDSNLFTITCEAPKPVEVKYYLKNNWNGAAEWSWKEMTKKEEAYVLDSVIFGGTGVNLNTKEEDADAKWFDLKKMKYNEQDTIQVLDTVRFELSVSDKDTVLTAIKLGRPAPAPRKEFVFVAGEAAEANPALFAITWGKDGSNETVKLANKADDIYTAEILETVDSLVLVRCASDAAEIIWDGEGKNVWNQTGNYAICDTMYFGAWVDDSNLFTITCEAPKPIETKYYAKNNWNGAAADNWSWLEMSATDQENIYMLDSVVFGGTGVNINTKEDDTDALWFAADAITVLDDLDGLPGPIPPEPRKRDTIPYAPAHSGVVLEAPTLLAGDTIKLFFNAADSTLKAFIIGRPEQPQPAEVKYYVTGNAALVGEDNAWNAQAIEMIDSTYTFTELAAGEYEMKITNGAWDPEGQSWGSAALSEECSAGVGDKDGNIHFIVETPNDVTVSIAEGSVTVTGTFKQVATGITVNVTVPEGTPACFFYGEMSGNSFVEMDKVDDTHYTTTFAEATSIGWGYLFAWEKDNWNTKNAEGDFKVEPVNGVINVEVKAWVTAPGTEYKYTTYTEWQVKYGPAWEWVNTTKQEDGTFTVEAVWGNTGINIASGENPIKQDWYPLDDAALTVAEDVVEGDNVVITLTVVDDETVALNVKKGQEPATPDFGLLVNGTDYLPGTPEDKDTYTEYVVNTQLAIGEFVQLYDNVNKAAWTVTPEGSGFTDFEIHDNAYYIKQAGSYQFYIKIPKEGMESGLYVGFQGSGTNLNKVKAAQGQRFNILGLPVNANYRGIVIMNGQTYLQ